MPSSRPNTIPTVIHLVRQLKPRSILDVGVGFGKWGHLFREYTDILEAERDPARYQRNNWQVRIDGIEGFPEYLTDMHRYLYNEVHVGDARELIRRLPDYDLIFLGDILEHLSHDDGDWLLRDAFAHANKAVVVTTPKYETRQADLCGNELERHRSLWTTRDFGEFPGAITRTIDRATLIIVLPKPGVPALKLTPPIQPSEAVAHRLQRTLDLLARTIPHDEPFILVDEDQFRQEIPHTRAIPFLENDGRYWGPPGDDATAIRELERLREAGAQRLVFVWSCFWWLEHFQEFHRHVSTQYKQTSKNRNLIAFDLRAAPTSDGGIRAKE